MTKKTPKELPEANKNEENSMEENTEQPILDKEEVEAILGEIEEPEKREKLRFVLEQWQINLIQPTDSPDPETVRLITDSVENENKRRFNFATQQQKNEDNALVRSDERKVADQEFKEKQYDNNFKITFPAMVLTLLALVGLIIFSCYLIVSGEKEVGITLLVGIITSILGFLAGRGITLYQQKQ